MNINIFLFCLTLTIAYPLSITKKNEKLQENYTYLLKLCTFYEVIVWN